MAGAWSTFDGEERARIDEIVGRARSELAEAGVRGLGTRFPFGMHHDVMRTRLRRVSGGRTLRHDEVAELMNRWAREAGGPEVYAAQAVAGAVEWLAASRPETRSLIPASLAVGDTASFRDWALAVGGSPSRPRPGGRTGPVRVDGGIGGPPAPGSAELDDEWSGVALP